MIYESGERASVTEGMVGIAAGMGGTSGCASGAAPGDDDVEISDVDGFFSSEHSGVGKF